MRRKPGALVPFEVDICLAAAHLHARGDTTFHGYLLAKALKDDTSTAPGFGTLYRALGRLEKMGLVSSEWEDPHVAAEANRPRRRLYALTDAGRQAAADAQRAARAVRPTRKLVRA